MRKIERTHLHCAATQVQDFGAVVQALFPELRIRSQAQQVGIERNSYRVQCTFVNLCCQMALLLQAGFICVEGPEITHIHHLQQKSALKDKSIETVCFNFVDLNLVCHIIVVM